CDLRCGVLSGAISTEVGTNPQEEGGATGLEGSLVPLARGLQINNLNDCVCVCMYVCMYVCVCVCFHCEHLIMCHCVCVCVCVCVCFFSVSVCLCVCVCVCMCMCVWVYILRSRV